MQAELLLPLFTIKPRRYQAIYYLLTGKRTVSNLLAGLTYGLLPYFHFYPKLSQTDYQAALEQLDAKHDLHLQATDKTARLTAAGQLNKVHLLQQGIWPTTYDYWQDGDWQLQWERLLLSVQVISNYQHQVSHYVPLATQPLVQTDIRQWFYQYGRHQSTRFVTEFIQVVDALPESAAQLLANSLRSQSFVGLTDFELSLELNLSSTALALSRINALGAVLNQVRQLPNDAPLRHVFKFPNTVLSQGAANTYRLWLSGQPWQEIVQHSYQKESTLREHLLEAAILVPNFNFNDQKLTAIFNEAPDDYFVQRLTEIKQQRQEQHHD